MLNFIGCLRSILPYDVFQIFSCDIYMYCNCSETLHTPLWIPPVTLKMDVPNQNVISISIVVDGAVRFLELMKLTIY